MKTSFSIPAPRSNRIQNEKKAFLPRNISTENIENQENKIEPSRLPINIIPEVTKNSKNGKVAVDRMSLVERQKLAQSERPPIAKPPLVKDAGEKARRPRALGNFKKKVTESPAGSVSYKSVNGDDETNNVPSSQVVAKKKKKEPSRWMLVKIR